MEGGGRQSRLLSRLLGRLRGDQHKYSALEAHLSVNSTSESTEYGSTTNDEEPEMSSSSNRNTSADTYSVTIDDDQFAANIDLRYSGQYLTPEQLPEFCEQLHHLVEVIRNIQSYAKVTGEYPSELERRLEQEAREVASLAAEVRNARDVVARARTQRRALRAHRKQLTAHFAALKETEVRALESSVRLSDRKLFKSWEALKDSTDPAAFEPLLDEIRNKQTALECLVRLIDGKRSSLARTTPQPLPPPEFFDHTEALSVTTGASNNRKRCEGGTRRPTKRRRAEAAREPRSVPLSGEPSRHAPPPPPPQQVTLYIQGCESAPRPRAAGAGAVALSPLHLPAGGSVRDILFFTTR